MLHWLELGPRARFRAFEGLETAWRDRTMPESRRDQVAIVTGGGSGIGRAIAQEFLQSGATLVMVDLDQDRLDKVVGENKALGARVLGIRADVTNQADIGRVVDETRAAFGRIDVLCNNAGITDRQRPLLETPPEIWNRVIAVNLTAPYLFCLAVVPIMISQGGGAIVNVASIAGFLGGRSGFAYTASKHGIIGITRSIAVAYGDRGIRCNCISPGSVITNISSGEFGGEASPDAKALREKGLATRPSRATPDEIAPVAAFLASESGHYINGQNIVVDDGWTAY